MLTVQHTAPATKRHPPLLRFQNSTEGAGWASGFPSIVMRAQLAPVERSCAPCGEAREETPARAAYDPAGAPSPYRASRATVRRDAGSPPLETPLPHPPPHKLYALPHVPHLHRPDWLRVRLLRQRDEGAAAVRGAQLLWLGAQVADDDDKVTL